MLDITFINLTKTFYTFAYFFEPMQPDGGYLYES